MHFITTTDVYGCISSLRFQNLLFRNKWSPSCIRIPLLMICGWRFYLFIYFVFFGWIILSIVMWKKDSKSTGTDCIFKHAWISGLVSIKKQTNKKNSRNLWEVLDFLMYFFANFQTWAVSYKKGEKNILIKEIAGTHNFCLICSLDASTQVAKSQRQSANSQQSENCVVYDGYRLQI